MHIAYVSTDPGIPVFGCKGASIHVQEMLRAFLARGAEVTIFSPKIDDEPPADLEAVKCHRLPKIPKGNAAQRAAHLLELNSSVSHALEMNDSFDLVYERHALFAHAAMSFAKSVQIPSVLEVNAPLIDEQMRHRSLEKVDDAILSTIHAFESADHIVAVSPEVADYVKLHGASDSRVEVIPNAVNPLRFQTAAQFDGPFRIGFLGTLKPWHDLPLIADAFAIVRQSIPDAELLIVGDGPERSSLEAQLRKLGLLEATIFTGAVPAEEVPIWLNKMHVGLAPYRGSDSFYFSPLKLYEYMAAGLPVVISRVGNLQDAIVEGTIGFSVPPDDVEALAAVLIKLAIEPNRAKTMGGAARDHVLATHTWDNVAERILTSAGLGQEQAYGGAGW